MPHSGAHETHSSKSPAALAERVWDLADKIKVCMFTTWDGTRQCMRPLTALPQQEAHVIHFLVDTSSAKNQDVERFPMVALGFADPAGNHFLSISGEASLSNDRALIRELWNPMAKAWWDSADDPTIRVLSVTPTEAELWEGPNKAVTRTVMLAAAATGKRPPMGEHGWVKL